MFDWEYSRTPHFIADSFRCAHNRAGAAIFLIAALSIFTASLNAAQQYSDEQLNGMTIATIGTAGNVNTDRKTILSKVRSRGGELFNTKTASEDVKRINSIPGIRTAWYNTKVVDGKVELTFVVVEQNIVRKIEFVGNKSFKSKKLTKQLDFKKGDFLEATLAEAGREKLVDFYKEKGYPFAAAQLDYKQLEKGIVHYTVSEGTKVKINSITYKGNEKIKSGALHKITKLRKQEYILWQTSYNEQDIQKEISNIINAYYKRGFLNIAVTCDKNFNTDKTKVDLVFRISEGSIYTVNKVVFTGNKEFDSQTLAKVLKTSAGDIVDKQQVEADARELNKKYLESGFIDALVVQDLKFIGPDKVDIEYNIEEGKRFRIGQIEITGNIQTQDKVVRHILDEYDFTPGNFYNADIARGDGSGYLERMIRQYSYTESATIKPAGEKMDSRDAAVNIIEGKTGQVMIGAGISADAGIIGQIVYDERNFNIKGKPKNLWEVLTGRGFRGAGQELRISLEPGTEVSQYMVSFREPFLFDKPVSLDLSGARWQRFWESYNETRLKGFVGLEQRLKSRWRRSIGLRAENIDVGDIEEDAPREIKDVEGQNFLLGVRLGLGKTLTDDRFYPSTGFDFDTGYEQVTGDFTFGKLNALYQHFYTISTDLADRKTILSAKLYGATIVGDAPPFEKYYAGGSGLLYGIRGFRYRGVSTRGRPTFPDGTVIPGAEREDPIGSDWIALANAEVTVPFIGNNISWLLFTDSGVIDTGGLRASVGGGIQILIPQVFGPVPMRFELAAPLRKAEGDRTQTFSFSIGRLF